MASKGADGNAAVHFIRVNRVPIVVAVVSVILVGTILFGQHRLAFSLLFGPLIIGAMVVIANRGIFNEWIDSRRMTFQRWYDSAVLRSGKFAKFFMRPTTRASLWVWSLTDKISDEALRSGVRVSSVLYLWSAMIMLLAAAVYVIVGIVVTIAIIALVGWILSLGSDEPEPRRSTSDHRTVLRAAGQSGKRIKQKTGWFSEDEFGRVDADGRIYESTGTFSEEHVGRVDEDGAVYQSTGLFSEEQTHRVDDDGRIFKKTGMFSEDEVGRITEDGRILRKTGLFSEEEVGRVEDA
jgi:hypothetical protein